MIEPNDPAGTPIFPVSQLDGGMALLRPISWDQSAVFAVGAVQSVEHQHSASGYVILIQANIPTHFDTNPMTTGGKNSSSDPMLSLPYAIDVRNTRVRALQLPLYVEIERAGRAIRRAWGRPSMRLTGSVASALVPGEHPADPCVLRLLVGATTSSNHWGGGHLDLEIDVCHQRMLRVAA